MNLKLCLSSNCVAFLFSESTESGECTLAGNTLLYLQVYTIDNIQATYK